MTERHPGLLAPAARSTEALCEYCGAELEDGGDGPLCSSCATADIEEAPASG